MANKCSLFLCAFLLFAGTALGSPKFPDISIGDNQTLQGVFTQTQIMQGFDMPLVSKGNFVLAPKRGIKWNVVSPFPSIVTITPEGLTQESNGSNTSLKTDSLPKLKEMYQLIQGVIEGDWQELGSYFTMTLESDAGRWDAQLSPIVDEPGFPYAAISVAGAMFVERVEMKNKNGDVEIIDFSDIELDTAPENIDNLFISIQ